MPLKHNVILERQHVTKIKRKRVTKSPQGLVVHFYFAVKKTNAYLMKYSG